MKEINVGGTPTKKQAVAPKPAIQPRRYKDSFLTKIISVIKEDIDTIILKKRAIADEPPVGWEDYKQFLELARKK